MSGDDEKIRLDKWLWAARFYKTRSLATEAIKGGKVHVNDCRAKAGKIVERGQLIRMRKESIEMTVEVMDLSDKRGPAVVAQQLYQETAESITRREVAASQRKAAQLNLPPPKRPTKKQRREIIRFKQDI